MICQTRNEQSALFNLPGLGDSKPSELMDSMLSLLGTHTPCFLFRHLFLQQLPDYVRVPLAPSSTDNYRALAQEADKIYLAGRQKLTRSQHTTTHPQSQIQQATDGQTMCMMCMMSIYNWLCRFCKPVKVGIEVRGLYVNISKSTVHLGHTISSENRNLNVKSSTSNFL